jgi:hypothetical protein
LYGKLSLLFASCAPLVTADRKPPSSKLFTHYLKVYTPQSLQESLMHVPQLWVYRIKRFLDLQLQNFSVWTSYKSYVAKFFHSVTSIGPRPLYINVIYIWFCIVLSVLDVTKGHLSLKQNVTALSLDFCVLP